VFANVNKLVALLIAERMALISLFFLLKARQCNIGTLVKTFFSYINKEMHHIIS
jgi:hypothetical protein